MQQNEEWNYFNLLNLTCEPFSNSPDPDFLYPSRQHKMCLLRLEMSIRLRRGLNVIVGDVGTGKTTLSRELIRKLEDDENVEVHLILDPDFSSPREFLVALVEILGLPAQVTPEDTEWRIKDSLKNYLFDRAGTQGKIVVLIMDEGQKAPFFVLEILREILNFEMNDYKFLQIVVFAQKEFSPRIRRIPNFLDRINYYCLLKPLNFLDTRGMIRFRVNRAKAYFSGPPLFTNLGLLAMYRATKGYPRQIIHLCHRVLLTMTIRGEKKADWSLVNWCAGMHYEERGIKPRRIARLSLAGCLLLAALVFWCATHRENVVSTMVENMVENTGAAIWKASTQVQKTGDFLQRMHIISPHAEEGRNEEASVQGEIDGDGRQRPDGPGRTIVGGDLPAAENTARAQDESPNTARAPVESADRQSGSTLDEDGRDVQSTGKTSAKEATAPPFSNDE